MSKKPSNVVAFQGSLGAYSHRVASTVFPKKDVLPCVSFDDVFAAVERGKAHFAVVPIENSTAGRVTDIHRLLPETSAVVIGEHFEPIHHCLLAPKGASIKTLRHVHSHVQALGQCRSFLTTNGLTPVVEADTAGAAAEIAERNDPSHGAIASALAADIYGLKIVKKNVEDTAHNTTRFLVMAHPNAAPRQTSTGPLVTSFLFHVKSIPAALYKAIGGFATNGVNLTKLESYILDGNFVTAQFYAEIEGDPADARVADAFDELAFFSHTVKILGTYPAHSYRAQAEKVARKKSGDMVNV